MIGPADVPERAEARPALRHILLYDGRIAGHFGNPLRSAPFVWRVDDPDVAIGRDALVLAIGAEHLLAVLRRKKCLDAVARAFRERALEQLHAPERRKLVQHHQQPVLVRRHRLAVREFQLHGHQHAHRHGQQQTDHRPQSLLIGAAGDDVERERALVVHQIEQPKLAVLGVFSDDRVLEQEQAGLGAAQDASPLARFAVEHVASRCRDNRMRAAHEMPVRPHLFPELVRLLIRVG